jgi:hypothetical protein
MPAEPPDGKPRYHLVVEALPDVVPAAVRLRRALKCLLRSFGLKCIRARLEGDEPPFPIDDNQPRAGWSGAIE